MTELIQTVVIAVISIMINSLAYYYLLDKHKNDKKKKGEFSKIKSLTMYGISILVFIIFIAAAYFINIFALELTSLALMVTLVLVAYLLAIVISIVHANMTVEYVKSLIRNNESSKRIVVLIIHNILILGVTYASIYAFVPLVDYFITNVLRIIMLAVFILSFTLVIIYKDSKEPIIKRLNISKKNLEESKIK